MSVPHNLDTPDAILARARQMLAENRRDEAYASYLEVLAHDHAHPAALHELGQLAYAEGHRSAAHTIYRQIIRHWPSNVVGHINLANILYEEGNLADSAMHFRAVLAIDADSTDAHRGLAQVLTDQGDAEMAALHWHRSFPGQSTARQIYRGSGVPIPLLLLVSTQGGNIPTRGILDDRIFSITALYTEHYKPNLPLPPHVLVFNAIGDADLCPVALDAAEEIIRRTSAPVINQPSQVRRSGRASNAARLAGISGVHAPRILTLPRTALDMAKTLTFPVLMRAPGFHTGRHFVRVECQEDIERAAAEMPGETLLVIEYLDARGQDGMARKYRVMCIDGKLYPMHLAISADWKVHYFASDMATNAAHRAEERRFLEDMPAFLGPAATAALSKIGEMLGLDYGGIDFALGDNGTVIVFEANATMVILRPPPEPMWDYRRAPVERVFGAAKDLVTAKLGQSA
jgi:hypothetical protein